MNVVNYYNMKYQTNITNKFAKFLNKNTINVKIAFVSNIINLTKHINNRNKNFIKCSLSFENASIY